MSVLGVKAIPIDIRKYKLSVKEWDLRSFTRKQKLARNITQSSRQLNYSVYFTEQDAIIRDKGKLIKMNYREIKRP